MTSIRLRGRQNREALEEDLNVNRRVFSIEKQQVAMMGEEQPITNPNDESRKDIVEKFVNALRINIERSMNALVPLYTKSRKAEFLQAVSIVPMTIDWNMISSNYINPSNTQNSRDEMLTDIQSLSSPIQELFNVVKETINYQGTIFFVDLERYGAPMKETFNVIKLLLKLFTLVKLIKDRLFVSNIRPITKGEFDIEFNNIKNKGEEYFSRAFADQLRYNLSEFNNFLFEGPDDDDDESDAFSRTTESSYRPDDDPRDNPDDGYPAPSRSSGYPLPREKQEEGEMGSALLTESTLGLPREYSASLSPQTSPTELTLAPLGTESALLPRSATQETEEEDFQDPVDPIAPPEEEDRVEEIKKIIIKAKENIFELDKELASVKDETTKLDLERLRKNNVGTLARLRMEYKDLTGQDYGEAEVPASEKKKIKIKKVSIFDEEPKIDPNERQRQMGMEMALDIPDWNQLSSSNKKTSLGYAFPELVPFTKQDLELKLKNIQTNMSPEKLKDKKNYLKEIVYIQAIKKGLKKLTLEGKGKASGSVFSNIRKSNSNNREKLVMKNVRMAKPKELEYDDDRDDNYGNYRLE